MYTCWWYVCLIVYAEYHCVLKPCLRSSYIAYFQYCYFSADFPYCDIGPIFLDGNTLVTAVPGDPKKRGVIYIYKVA